MEKNKTKKDGKRKKRKWRKNRMKWGENSKHRIIMSYYVNNQYLTYLFNYY